MLFNFKPAANQRLAGDSSLAAVVGYLFIMCIINVRNKVDAVKLSNFGPDKL